MLATPTRLAKGRYLKQDTPHPNEPFTGKGQDRLFSCSGRFGFSASRFWGAKTGPNATDRRKLGSKHHLITDTNGIPFAVKVTGANRHDVTQLLPLVESIPPIAGKVGHPRKRPDCVLGDRAYDSQPHRDALHKVGINSLLAKRRTGNGSGLGVFRWVFEWERLKNDLDSLEEITVRAGSQAFIIRSETRGDVGRSIQAAGVGLGPVIRPLHEAK